MIEKKIIQNALQNLNRLTGYQCNYELTNKFLPAFNAQVQLIRLKSKPYLFQTKIKNELRAVHLPQLIKEHKNKDNNLIISQYLSKEHREQLRNLQINYLDSSGNCYIKHNTLFIFIDNQKVTMNRATKSRKLFSQTGLKIIYAFLLNPDLINMPYRTIAVEAGIALSTVSLLLSEMQESGYIKMKGDERILCNKDELVIKWAEYYNDKLEPKIFRGRFKFIKDYHKDPDYWKTLKLKNAFWGGEPAANILDRFLQPQEFIIYSKEDEYVLMKQLKLVPDLNGNIKLLTPPINKMPDNNVADPYLIYADLIYKKDSRCLEAAQRIKEKYLDAK